MDMTPEALWALMLAPIMAASSRLSDIELTLTDTERRGAKARTRAAIAPPLARSDNRPARPTLCPI